MSDPGREDGRRQKRAAAEAEDAGHSYAPRREPTVGMMMALSREGIGRVFASCATYTTHTAK